MEGHPYNNVSFSLNLKKKILQRYNDDERKKQRQIFIGQQDSLKQEATKGPTTNTEPENLKQEAESFPGNVKKTMMQATTKGQIINGQQDNLRQAATKGQITSGEQDNRKQDDIIHIPRPSFICSICKRSFTLRYSLKRHMRIHSGVRPFTCSDCGKTFTRKDHLNVHRKIHLGNKLLQCEYHPYSPRRNDTLNSHLKARYNRIEDEKEH